MKFPWNLTCRFVHSSSKSKSVPLQEQLKILGKDFTADTFCNVTPKILSHVGKNIYLKQYHPLSLVRENIINYFYSTFKGRTGNPIFSVYDSLHPVVTVEANFDSLLVPANHVSREKKDCYYVNQNSLLRSHMTAHQCELMKMGLNNFLMIGDVYRRDEIDATHYPVFHQLDCVRLSTAGEVRVQRSLYFENSLSRRRVRELD